MTDVERLVHALFAVLSEDEDGHAWTDEALDVATEITKTLDNLESVMKIADDESDVDYPTDTPMADEYGG